LQSTTTLSLKKILIFIILAILVSSMSFLILPGKIYGATLYVGGTEPGNYTTIQAAIAAAVSGDTIVVSSGTYNESLTISKNINLTGAGTVVIQAPAGRQGIVVGQLGSVTVNITGITISGSNSFNGGGIENFAGIITITNCTISGNTAENVGGGICNHSGSITIIDSTISGNSADNKGGGIYNDEGNITITNSTITNNFAYYGGGIYNDEGNITITNCTISGNRATHNSRGIYNWSSSKTVNAKSNWWGSATGPQNYSYNPGGTGDSIYGNIDYIPWLTNTPDYAEPEDEEADGEEIIPWVRDRGMTCYQVWINEDNNFEFVFWWEYENNNHVHIYDMAGNLVWKTDFPKGQAHFTADLPDGMYTVKTFHEAGNILQEFVIGKP